MKRLRRSWPAILLAILGIACQDPVPPPSQPAQKEPESHPQAAPASPLSTQQADLLEEWYQVVGHRRRHESYGALVARAATVQLGRPYFTPPQSQGPETQRIELATFDCVSLVESSLALARCIWKQSPSSECFVREMRYTQYREGNLVDYSSRLHYFYDWIRDHTHRNRIMPLTTQLGGHPYKRRFSVMTANVKQYPALKEPRIFEQVRHVEERLNKHHPQMLDRDKVATAEPELQSGDIIAVAGTKAGLLFTHTGFVLKGPDSVPRFLHASSHHKRVILTHTGIADYVARKSNRIGIAVARPIPP